MAIHPHDKTNSTGENEHHVTPTTCIVCDGDRRDRAIGLLTATMIHCRTAIRSLSEADLPCVETARLSLEHGLAYATQLAREFSSLQACELGEEQR